MQRFTEIEQNRILITLWEDNLNGLIIGDSSGNIVKVNDALCQILQYTAAELEGLHFREITHKDDVNKDWDLAQRVLDDTYGLQKYTIKKRYQTKLDTIIWVSLTVNRIEDTRGNFLYFLGQVTPLNQQKAADYLLEQKIDRYKYSKKSFWKTIKEWGGYIALALGSLGVILREYFGDK